MKIYKLTLSTLAVFAMAAAAQAQVLIDMQFSGGTSQTGAAVVGSGGDQWNKSGNGSGPLALNDVSGTASGVTLNWSAGGSFGSGNGFTGTAYENLMTNYLYSVSTTSTLTLTGLTPSSTYNLYLYSQPASDGGGRRVAFTPTGLITYGTQTTASANPVLSAFVLGTNYLEFLGLAPDAGGTLTISYVNFGALPEADLNGFQIQVVPEPGTWALLALTGTFFMVIRRRSRG